MALSYEAAALVREPTDLSLPEEDVRSSASLVRRLLL